MVINYDVKEWLVCVTVYALSTEDTEVTVGAVEHNNSFMQYQLTKIFRHVLEKEVIKLAQ